MVKYALIALLLTGCGTCPPTANIPIPVPRPPPPELIRPQLDPSPENATDAQVIKVLIEHRQRLINGWLELEAIIKSYR